MSDVRLTSQLTKELSQRIQTNQKFGDADLKSWVMSRIDLKQTDRLLDIGCGTGAYIIPFAQSIKTDWACIGTDISEASINSAKQTADQQGLKIKFFVESMDQLEASKKMGPFSVMTFVYSAYYSKDATRMLNGLLNVLEPNGRLVILGPYMDNNQEWFDFIRQFMSIPKHALESSGMFMTNTVLPFALERFNEVKCFRFVNNIVMPSLVELQRYWEASTYFDAKHNEAFQKLAEEHFKKHSEFKFRKAALLTIMQGKRA